MADVTNFVNISKNLSYLPDIFTVADGYTGGILGFAIWLMIGLGSFFLMGAYRSNERLISSTFVLAITSLFLKYLNLLSDSFLWISIILFLGSIILSFSSRSSQGA